jgi:hypothetical protein
MTDTTTDRTDLDRFADAVRSLRAVITKAPVAYQLAALFTGSDAYGTADDASTRRMHYLHHAADCGSDAAMAHAICHLALRAVFRTSIGVADAHARYGMAISTTFDQAYRTL